MEQPDAVGATEIIKLAVPGPRAVQTNVDEFHKLAQPFLEQDCPKIIVDMSRVEFVDSSFLGALVMLLKRAVARHGDLKIFGLQRSVRTLFEMLRLYRIFDIHETEDSARRSFGGS